MDIAVHVAAAISGLSCSLSIIIERRVVYERRMAASVCRVSFGGRNQFVRFHEERWNFE